MHTQRLTAAVLTTVLATALASGCSGDPDEAGEANRGSGPGASTATAPARSDARARMLTDANLEAYARALQKQAEIIRRPGRGTHYGVRISAYGEDDESREVLEAAGMTASEYNAVDQLVEPVFTTLNFQGEIGPPRSINLDEASPEWRERLERDPFDDLAPESAAALRRHMDTLVPLWSDVVGLTAQHGR